MASEIYKEWFVRLRFPNYQNTPFLNAEGKQVPHGTPNALPKGWEIRKVEDSFKIVGGGTPSTSEESYWTKGEINWFSPTDITASSSIFLEESSRKITKDGLGKSAAKIFPPKCIMMTSRATIGAVGINLTEACTNQGFITCIPNEMFPYTYIYHWIISNRTLFENFSGGATFKEISRGVFKSFNIPKIEQTLIESYHNMVSPLFEEINILGQKNQLLQETRDLLLPRLISGKLSVADLPEPASV